METIPQWQRDETRQVGTDFSDPAQVAIYDNYHQKFRDIKAENESMLDYLDLKSNHTVLDMGAGTGFFAIGL